MDVDWKIQCVTFKYFDTIEALFKSFDINVCRIAYDGTNVVYESNVVNEINNNKLKFNEGSIYYPSVTLKRLVKYVKMGYDVEDVDLKLLTHAFYKCKKKAIDVLDQDLLTKKHIPINNYEALK
jgi:glycyl-tRNA synthetase alpha subunit